MMGMRNGFCFGLDLLRTEHEVVEIEEGEYIEMDGITISFLCFFVYFGEMTPYDG